MTVATPKMRDFINNAHLSHELSFLTLQQTLPGALLETCTSKGSGVSLSMPPPRETLIALRNPKCKRFVKLNFLVN